MILARTFVFGCVILLASVGSAHAQGPACGDRAGIVAHLEKRYGEQTAVLALDAAGGMVQILANAETGTWTLLLVRPGGLACLAGHGTDWEPIPSTGSGQAPPPAAPGHPT